MSTESLVWNLLQAADGFIHNAQDLKLSSENRNLYNLYIKGALNCYFKVLRNFSNMLDANIQSILYYRTSQLLFNETISHDLAIQYCNKGIHLCKRNEPLLTLTKLKLQYLNLQLQFLNSDDSNSEENKHSLNLINSIISDEIPNDDSYLVISTFFKFIKIKYFNIFLSNENNITHLQKLCDKLTDSNSQFKFLVMVEILQLKLFNNDLVTSVNETFEQLVVVSKSIDLEEPKNIHFNAMLTLYEVLINLHSSDFNKTKEKIAKLDAYINTVKKNSLLWSSKILINLKMNDKKLTNFPVEFKWLSFSDFQLLSYFYCGILYSFKSWDGKNKSKKILELVSQSLEKRLISVTHCTFKEMNDRKLKLSYFKILNSFYILLSDIISNRHPMDLKSYPELEKFIKNSNQNILSDFERIIYTNIAALAQFILAINNQKKGNLMQAVYHHNQVIRFYENKSSMNTNPILSNYLQSNIGVLGSSSIIKIKNNEIYMMSLLNSLIVLIHLIQVEKTYHDTVSEFDENYNATMKKFQRLLSLKESLSTKLHELDLNCMKTNCKLLISSIAYFESISKEAPFTSSLDMSKIESESPYLVSLLYLIKAYSYKNDPGISELANLNSKVALFNNACRCSVKALGNEATNKIAVLGYTEIYNIMNCNKNMYSEEDTAKVFEKLKYFQKDQFNAQVEENNTTVKRVKFA